MKNSELVKEIESKYNVTSIKHKSLNLWLELRNRIYGKISLGEESGLTITKQTYKTVLNSVFYGFFNWFKSYDAWFFSSQINRLNIKGVYYDRIFDYPATQFKKPLFIELTTSKHYKRNKVFSKYIVSRSLLILMEKIYALFVSVDRSNLEEYNRISSDYNIDVNPSYGIKKMVSQHAVMKFLLKFTKPKYVFVAPMYTCYGYIKAFKKYNIKVIEIQHGVINNEHFGYNLNVDFDNSYFADYLLTFGEQEKFVFKGDNRVLNSKQVIPIGNFYLDHIKENYTPNKTIEDLKHVYKYTFTVSLQELEVPLKIIPELIKVANNNSDLLFILKPRKKDKLYYESNYNLPKNIVVIEDINVYQLILDSDFHITVYSTCALEAPALGKMNILFNIENKSNIIFGSTLKDNGTSIFVNNSNEFEEVISKLKKTDESIVMNNNKSIIYSNYKERVKKVFDEIL